MYGLLNQSDLTFHPFTAVNWVPVSKYAAVSHRIQVQLHSGLLPNNAVLLMTTLRIYAHLQKVLREYEIIIVKPALLSELRSSTRRLLSNETHRRRRERA